MTDIFKELKKVGERGGKRLLEKSVIPAWSKVLTKSLQLPDNSVNSREALRCSVWGTEIILENGVCAERVIH